MYLPNEFIYGLSFGLIGVIGMYFRIVNYLESDDEEDLQNDVSERYIDAETGDEVSNINKNVKRSILEMYYEKIEENLFVENNFEGLEELHSGDNEKLTSRELQSRRLEECFFMNFEPNCKDTCELSYTVEKLKNNVEKQKLKIEEINNYFIEVKTLKLDIMSVKNDLYRMNTNINEIKSEIMLIERSVEKPNRITKLKNRIGNLERDVTKNTANIIGMNYTYQTLISPTSPLTSPPIYPSISPPTPPPPPPPPFQPPPPFPPPRSSSPIPPPPSSPPPPPPPSTPPPLPRP